MKYSLFAGVLLTVFVLQVTAVAAPVTVTRAEDVGMSSERLEYLTSYFEGLADDQRSGGFQLLISRHGKVVLYENMGLANVEESIPVTDETLFRRSSTQAAYPRRRTARTEAAHRCDG